MDDPSRLIKVQRVRSAKLAVAERSLTEAAKMAAMASAEAARAEDIARTLLETTTLQNETEHRHILASSFQIEALKAHAEAVRTSKIQVSAANDLAQRIREQAEQVERQRTVLARKVQAMRQRKDSLDVIIAKALQARRNRLEEARIQEFAESAKVKDANAGPEQFLAARPRTRPGGSRHRF